MEHPLVRGIYVTGPAAGSERMDELIALLDDTELNTMVIDVKNDVPDACPYETVAGALALSVQELKDVPEERRAAVRPWLQAFTASWVDGFISYGEEEIRQQVQAVYDAGYEEWILWNSASSYVAE